MTVTKNGFVYILISFFTDRQMGLMFLQCRNRQCPYPKFLQTGISINESKKIVAYPNVWSILHHIWVHNNYTNSEIIEMVANMGVVREINNGFLIDSSAKS